MNARKSINRKMTSTVLGGALLVVLSFNAIAQTTATLDTRAPIHATLLPGIKVSVSISDPSATVRWSIAPGRPIPVTLMPTLTITADAHAVAMTTLPTIPVFAQTEIPAMQASPVLAQAMASRSPTLGIAD